MDLQESRLFDGDPGDFERPVDERFAVGENVSAQQEALPPALHVQRLRFIAALEERQRRKREALPGARVRARSRERILSLTREIAEERFLVLANGLVLKHVAELASCLDQLPIEVFRRHVSDLRNDFAQWVLEVFDDPALGERIQCIDQPKYLQLEIYRYLAGREPGDSE